MKHTGVVIPIPTRIIGSYTMDINYYTYEAVGLLPPNSRREICWDDIISRVPDVLDFGTLKEMYGCLIYFPEELKRYKICLNNVFRQGRVVFVPYTYWNGQKWCNFNTNVDCLDESYLVIRRVRKELPPHKDIRICFEVGNRKYEAVGFLNPDEGSVRSRTLFERMPDAIDAEDAVYLLKNLKERWNEELWRYVLVTGYYDPKNLHPRTLYFDRVDEESWRGYWKDVTVFSYFDVRHLAVRRVG